MKQKKQCACGAWFTPYPRAWKTQKTCSKTCRARRLQELCCRWRKKNPDYFKGRFPNTKRWLAKRSNYLRRYRTKHPDYVAADNEKRRERRLRQKYRRADIQNTLRLHIDGIFDVLAGIPRTDIQNRSVIVPLS